MSDQSSTFDESLLSAFLDGELHPVERAAVDEQLAASPELRALLDELRATRDSVRELPAVEPPAGFYENMLDDSNVVDLGAARTRRTGHGRRWAALSSAAAAAVFVAIVAVPHPTRVTPRLSDLTESHAERSSVQNDPVSNLAPVSAAPAP